MGVVPAASTIFPVPVFFTSLRCAQGTISILTSEADPAGVARIAWTIPYRPRLSASTTAAATAWYFRWLAMSRQSSEGDSGAFSVAAIRLSGLARDAALLGMTPVGIWSWALDSDTLTW